MLRRYKTDIRKTQRNLWRNFCSGIEKVTKTARLRELLSKQPTIQSLLKLEAGR